LFERHGRSEHSGRFSFKINVAVAQTFREAPPLMSDHRAPPSAVVNEHLRNNALTAFLVLESLIIFIAAPLSAMGIHAPLLFGGVLCTLLLLAIVMISRSTGARIITAIATVLAIAGAAFRVTYPSPISLWLGHLAVIGAILGISVIIVQAVFAPGRITYHRIEGAVILYLNVALAFTSVYRLIEELDPNAFASVPARQTEAAAASNMLYFSFTTLTSTGFGEILPINPFARSMANLESVLGQLYLAILLARLVTMHVETRRY
jgi:hypothetical protein